MTPQFDCHIFAHRNGAYQTVHSSAGVTSGEKAALEQFFFGQTNDEAYLASLADEPGLIWRSIGDRWALTRVRNGKRDANGRATLQFETLVLPRTATHLLGNVPGLVRAGWQFTADGASVGEPPTDTDGEVHPEIVSKIVMAIREAKRITRKSGDLSLADVGKILTMCRSEPDFSLCYKSLNPQAPVSVNLLFGGADGVTRMIGTSSKKGLPPAASFSRAREPARSGVTGTQLLIMLGFLALVTLQVVSLFGGLSGGSSGSPDSTVQNNIITHIEQEHRKMQQAIAQLADDQKSESANLRSRLDAFDDWHQRQATDLGQLRGKLDELKEQAKGYEGNLSTLIKKADDEFGADQEKARAALQGAIDQISKSVAEVGQKLGKLNDGSKSTVEELRGLREEITKLTVDLNAVRKQVKELSDKVNRS